MLSDKPYIINITNISAEEHGAANGKQKSAGRDEQRLGRFISHSPL
jgi:hypothetical protein